MQQVETLLLLVFRSVMKYSILTPPPHPLGKMFCCNFQSFTVTWLWDWKIFQIDFVRMKSPVGFHVWRQKGLPY